MTNLNVDFRALANSAMPHFLRQPKLSALVKTVMYPLQDKNADLVELQRTNFSAQTTTSQVVSLEGFLNAEYGIAYDPATRDADIAAGNIIYIETLDRGIQYVFKQIEGKDVLVYKNEDEGTTFFLYTNNEITSGQPDFTVWIPTGLFTPFEGVEIDKFKAFVDFYKLAGKVYELKEY